MTVDGSLVDQTAVHPGAGAEGGIVSSAADTGRFLIALMQGRLPSSAGLARMKTRTFWSGGQGIAGVGFAVVALYRSA